MANKNVAVAHRAWKLLRLALLLARKGVVFTRRLMMELRLVSKFLKSLGHTAPPRRRQIHYGERELSFDRTPIFQVRMHRPRSGSVRFINIPCITPQVDDLNSDADDEPGHNYEQDEVYEYGCCDEYYGHYSCYGDNTPVGEEGIDLRAEKFIAQFYKQMKLQRQVSYLEHYQ